MASTLSDGNKGPPLLYWGDDRLSSPIHPPFLTKYSARHTSETSPAIPTPNTGHGSPRENALLPRDLPSSLAGTDRNNPLNTGGPVTHLHGERLSIDPIRENADYSRAEGSFHWQGSTEPGLDESTQMEIDSLLDELMDYPSKRDTMSSAPLLPLPEELSPTDGPIDWQPPTVLSPPPLLTVNMSYSGDSDTPSLISSSPRSSKDSHFSSASPSLKSKRSFTPITPSTDGWRSPPTHAVVPERVSCLSNESRRAHYSNLPPLRTMIPEDATMRRRANTKNSMSSEYTVTNDQIRRVETSIDHPVSSYFSDDDASEITEIGYVDSGFDPVYLSVPGAFSPHFTRPRPPVDASRASGPGNLNSPTPSISSGSVDYLPPSDSRYPPSPKRGMFHSLFSPNGTSEQKKERKRAKAWDSIQTQPSASRSTDAVSFVTTSSKSSRDKERKKAEKEGKAAKRAQLAARLGAKQPPHPADENLGGALRPTDAQKGSTPWEESGAMYSLNGIF